jgi:signal transduction histidine kinase
LKGESILAEPSLVVTYLFTGVVAAVFGLWANAIIRESRSCQELIERLEATQHELATAERQAGILEERQRLAREIHDTLAQGLTSIVLHLEAAEAALAQDSSAAQQHLDQARQTARDSLTEARRFVWALRPESLERDPLPKAIGRVAERWSEEHHLTARTNITGTRRSLPPEVEVTLLRATQEALANVAKHAHAREVTLTLSYMNDVVALDVHDNGLGFDRAATTSAPDGDNFGLVAMRQRVEQWGGTLTIESAPQEGTTLAIEIPIDKDLA